MSTAESRLLLTLLLLDERRLDELYKQILDLLTRLLAQQPLFCVCLDCRWICQLKFDHEGNDGSHGRRVFGRWDELVDSLALMERSRQPRDSNGKRVAYIEKRLLKGTGVEPEFEDSLDEAIVRLDEDMCLCRI